MITKLFFLLSILFFSSCITNDDPVTIDLSKNWHFSPDTNNLGMSEQWYSKKFDDSNWKVIDAGERWEDVGYKNLDSYGWYRKVVDIPKHFKEKKT